MSMFQVGRLDVERFNYPVHIFIPKRDEECRRARTELERKLAVDIRENRRIFILYENRMEQYSCLGQIVTISKPVTM